MTDWRDRAACVGHNPKYWHPFEQERTTNWSGDHYEPYTSWIRNGRRICYGCPVRLACLDAAIANRERFGIWGGMTPPERRQEARRRELKASWRVAS